MMTYFNFWVSCAFNNCENVINQSMDSPLVQSSVCDVTSEACCCDVTMTSFSSLVITWHSRLGRLAPVRWTTAETRWMNSVTLDWNIPLICDRALFSPLYGSWSRTDGILERCHVDVWTETKIVCMINSGPFVLWPKIENNIQYMCTLHTWMGTSGRRRSGSVRSKPRWPHSVPCAGTWEHTQTVTLHLPAD